MWESLEEGKREEVKKKREINEIKSNKQFRTITIKPIL